MPTELSDLDGLDRMTATGAEGYANVVLEFEFGWNKSQTLADVRDAMSKAESQFPSGFEQYSITEFNFSEFPIIIVNLTGAVPERTLREGGRIVRRVFNTAQGYKYLGVCREDLRQGTQKAERATDMLGALPQAVIDRMRLTPRVLRA